MKLNEIQETAKTVTIQTTWADDHARTESQVKNSIKRHYKADGAEVEVAVKEMHPSHSGGWPIVLITGNENKMRKAWIKDGGDSKDFDEMIK